MTIKEAVETIKQSNFVAENVKEWRAIHQLFDIAKRFGGVVEVPYKYDPVSKVPSYGDYINFQFYCQNNNIDQKRIKRIWIEMESDLPKV